jgi:YesN/AraC family two-component response regulator
MARILVVDDSAVMRRNLEKILTEGGHEVVGQAISGMQAVVLYSELNPDVVTMDITMPIMNGVDAVKYIINKDVNAKIIMISALNQKNMVFEALNNGAKNYILKPLDPEGLLKSINEVLSNHTTRSVEAKEIDVDKEIGFHVENINGSFVFVFNNNISIEDVAAIETAVKGLLFVKPLNIIFDFGKSENINDSILLPIMMLAKQVRDASGSIKYASENEKLLERISELDIK